MSSPSPFWQPPAGFIPVESALAGVTVFAPAPAVEAPAAPPVFQCPQCGAATRYDVAAGGVACEHCGYTAPVQAQTVGQAAAQDEFTLEALQRGAQGWGVARKELHCNACGADLALAPGALTATCPFCASNQVTVRDAADDRLRPRFLIPFQLQPDAVKARAREWLGKGWYHPDELSRSALIEHFTGVYLPFWTFDARITADWRAEVGYEHQERYYDAGSKSWRTRTVIRWRWETGRVPVTVDDLPQPGTSRVSARLLERLQPFDLGALTDYTPDFLAGWQAQGYDVPLPQAWEAGKAVMRERARQACRDDIASAHVRNFSMTADFADEAWRYLLLPVYVAAYRFEGKVYQVMINGQTGAVAGQKPVAWWKVWLAVAALLVPGLCAGLIGLPLLLAGGVGIVPLVIGAVLLAVGGGAAIWLYQRAAASEAA